MSRAREEAAKQQVEAAERVRELQVEVAQYKRELEGQCDEQRRSLEAKLAEARSAAEARQAELLRERDEVLGKLRAAEEKAAGSSERLSADHGAQQLELARSRDELARVRDELARVRDEAARLRDEAAEAGRERERQAEQLRRMAADAQVAQEAVAREHATLAQEHASRVASLEAEVSHARVELERGMKRASTEASQSRWSRNPCGGCMAANFANNGILEGPKKCARCDPGRNHYRELQQETERIAACRERRLRKEANRLAKHRRLAPEQSRRRERSSDASGPTVTTAQPTGMRPISSYYHAPE